MRLASDVDEWVTDVKKKKAARHLTAAPSHGSSLNVAKSGEVVGGTAFNASLATPSYKHQQHSCQAPLFRGT
jgi:hypothetical protein